MQNKIRKKNMILKSSGAETYQANFLEVKHTAGSPSLHIKSINIIGRGMTDETAHVMLNLC
jgi:hypothetical protein